MVIDFLPLFDFYDLEIDKHLLLLIMIQMGNLETQKKIVEKMSLKNYYANK